MPELRSTLTCPYCGRRETLTMPTDACLFFHVCLACGRQLRPRPGHCCVFCSFGDVPCPPMQGVTEEPAAMGCGAGAC